MILGRKEKPEAAVLTEQLLETVSGRADRVAFIESRFHSPLHKYRKASHVQAVQYIVVNVLTAAGGLATSAIVASGGTKGGWKIAIAVIGLLVGILSVFNQVRRPGQRNAAYARAWHDLRSQGWS
jgi:hypothetical protein